MSILHPDYNMIVWTVSVHAAQMVITLINIKLQKKLIAENDLQF